MDQLIFDHFQQRIEATMTFAEQCRQQLPAAASLIAERLVGGGKVIVCAGPDERLLGELTENYLLYGSGFERPPFPVLALTGHAQANWLTLLGQHANSADLLLLLGDSLTPTLREQLLNEAVRNGVAVVTIGAVASAAEPSPTVAVSLTAVEPSSTPLVNRQLEALQCLCHLVDHQVFGA